jgi:hypothetical protein
MEKYKSRLTETKNASYNGSEDLGEFNFKIQINVKGSAKLSKYIDAHTKEELPDKVIELDYDDDFIEGQLNSIILAQIAKEYGRDIENINNKYLGSWRNIGFLNKIVNKAYSNR